MTKKNFIFIYLCLLSICLFAQNDTAQLKKESGLFLIVETFPSFVGGQTALNKYLETSIHYTPKAINDYAQGKVYLEFWVEIDGSISNPKIVQGLHPDLDSISLLAVSNMPKWEPAKEKSIPIKKKMAIPIEYNLSSVKKSQLSTQQKYWINNGKNDFYKKCMREFRMSKSECDCWYKIVLNEYSQLKLNKIDLEKLFDRNDCK